MRSLIVLMIALIVVATAFADVPQVISYQGRLTDTKSGKPLDGEFDVTFRLYTVKDGAESPVWSETHEGVQIEDGLYNIMLGSVEAFTGKVNFSEQYWLGVTIGNGPELTPRYQLSASPYALNIASMGAENGQILIWSGAQNKWVPVDVDKLIADEEKGKPTDVPHGPPFPKGEGTPNYVVKWFADDSLGDSQIFDDGTNVGIGTTTPEYKLAVVGDVGITGDLDLSAGTRILDSDGNYPSEDCILMGTEDGGAKWSCGVPPYKCSMWATKIVPEEHYLFNVLETARFGCEVMFMGITKGGQEPISGGTNQLIGTSKETHVNLGGNSITGDPDYPEGNYLYCTVAGGYNNAAEHNYSFIGGGENNTADSNWTTVCGGSSNTARGNGATVCGGLKNTADYHGAFIGGGVNNYASGWNSFIGGGLSDTVTGRSSVVPGGSGNAVSGEHSFAFGRNVKVATNYTAVFFDELYPGRLGINHESPQNALEINSTIAGASGLRFTNLTSASTPGAAGDIVLTVDANGDVILVNDAVDDADNSPTNEIQNLFASIEGPGGSPICPATTPTDIIRFNNGTNTTVNISQVGNRVEVTYNATGGPGADEDWIFSTYAGDPNIPDGVLCSMDDPTHVATYAGLARGGANNYMYGTNVHTHVNWGVECTTGVIGFPDDDMYCTVSGGWRNEAGKKYAAVGGGQDNSAWGGWSTVGGGYLNACSTSYSTISGGYENKIFGVSRTNGGTIGGGMYNRIYSGAPHAVIAGGRNNTIYDGGWDVVMGGGWLNKAYCGQTVISGGRGNVISDSAGFSVISGGRHNRIDKQAGYSVIPGGSYNNIKMRCSYSFAFGNGVRVTDDYVAAFFSNEDPFTVVDTIITGPGTTYVSTVVTPTPGKLSVNNPKPHSTLQADGSFATTIIKDYTSTTLDLHGSEGEKNFTIFANGVDIDEVILPDPADCEGRIYVIRNTSQTAGETVIVKVTDAGTRIDYDDAWPVEKKDGIIVQSNGGTQWWVIAKIDTP